MTNRGRPHLPLGTFGKMTVEKLPPGAGNRGRYVATTRFRDSDGHTRRVTAQADTGTHAASALKVKLAARQARVERTTIGAGTTVADLFEQWCTENRDRWAANTHARYLLAGRHVVDELGAVRMAELSRAGINTALARIRTAHGWSSAKSAKSVLSGMCKLALLHDALPANPVRDTISVRRTERREDTRALTADEQERLVDAFRSDPEAVGRYDLADLTEWMLGTGCRIGEGCAARPKTIRDGTWEVNATVVRPRGKPLIIQERTKTDAGWRRLALPSYCLAMLERREGELTMSTGGPVIFGSPHRKGLRDPSNTAADLRVLLDRHGFEWVTSHTFRRTVATRLDDAGLSSRQVADQLGHANPSMTTDRYMGRRVVSADAAKILDR